MKTTLIKNGHVIRYQQDKLITDTADIAIEGNLIKEIGSIEDNSFDLIIDASDQIVMPGMFNMHTHVPMKVLQGLGEGLPLKEWLEDAVWPMERKLTAEDVHAASKMAMVELLYSGISCFNDMYFFVDSIAKAAEELGIRAVLCQAFFDWDINEAGIKEVLRSMHRYRSSEQIDISLGVHQLCDIKPDQFQSLIDTFRGETDYIHIHVAETDLNRQIINRNFGTSSAAKHLLSFNTEGFKILAAHCVHMDENDAELLEASNVYPINNPVSNAKLASGISPVSEFLKRDIPVCIGTDGSASNNNLNLLEEMKIGALVQKLKYSNPTAGSVEDFFRMATINGAKALGKEQSLGSIEVGKKADIVCFPIDHTMLPTHDLLTNLVYSGSKLRARNFLINGKPIILEDELKTSDLEKIQGDFQEMTSSLVKRLADET